MKIFDVIKKVVVTEKAVAGHANQRYVFDVSKQASKTQIKNAIQELFGVKVADVRTTTLPAKRKRNTRARAKLQIGAARKRAVVTLAEGQKLDVIEAA